MLSFIIIAHKTTNYWPLYRTILRQLSVAPRRASRRTIEVLHRASLRLRRILRLETGLVDSPRLLLNWDCPPRSSYWPFRASPGRCEFNAGIALAARWAAAGRRRCWVWENGQYFGVLLAILMKIGILVSQLMGNIVVFLLLSSLIPFLSSNNIGPFLGQAE